MLKIKDDKDLRLLEFYDFEIGKGDIFYSNDYFLVNKDTREIDTTQMLLYSPRKLDILYELIQAGLVEKVGK